MLQLIEPTKAVIVDSTPLVDLYDMESTMGSYWQEENQGFKLHAAVNQLGLPLRALVTPGQLFMIRRFFQNTD